MFVGCCLHKVSAEHHNSGHSTSSKSPLIRRCMSLFVVCTLLWQMFVSQVLALEGERTKAAADACEVRSELADLQHTCDRFELQNRLLQKLLDVQQKHNRSKVDSIQRFLKTSTYSADSAVSEVSMGSSGSDEEDSDDDSSAEHRMEDLLRAFHVNEQQRNMPPSLLPNGGLKKHKSRRHSPSQKKGRK